MAEQADDGVGVEEVGRILGGEAQATVGLLGGDEGEIVLGGRGLDGLGVHDQAGGAQAPARRVLEDEHHLEQRQPAALAHRRQSVDEPLEGDFLVGEPADGGLVHAPDEGAEAGPAGERRAQRQRVQEQADQALEVGPRPPGDQGADDDVGLPGGAREQRLEGGEDDDERSGLLLVGERMDAAHGRRGDPDAAPRAVGAGGPGPRMIGGELEDGVGVEAGAPVVELGIRAGAGEARALPGRERRVLQRQRRQRAGGVAAAAAAAAALDGDGDGDGGAVQRAELADEDGQGPGVGDEVVHVDEEVVPPRRMAKERQTTERAVLEIERLLGEGGDVLARPRRRGVVRARGAIEASELHVGLGRHHLPQAPIAVSGEGGAQRLVAPADGLEAARERFRVELALEAHRDGHVERRAAVAPLLQEPHPLLRERGDGELRWAESLPEQTSQERALLVGALGSLGSLVRRRERHRQARRAAKRHCSIEDGAETGRG